MIDSTGDLDIIPKKDLIEMLKDAAWYSGGREGFAPQGYSLPVNELTCYSDVLLDKEPLYETAAEAIMAYWKKHYLNAEGRESDDS